MEELEKNLMDMLAEQQLKLGFRKEQVTFYYPKASLEHLLGVKPGEEIAEKLSVFLKEAETRLGKIEISHTGERFRICVPEEGSVYVREHMGEQTFLKAFLEEISKPSCSSAVTSPRMPLIANSIGLYLVLTEKVDQSE